MSSRIIIDEYALSLSTGEEIFITELDSERSPIILDSQIQKHIECMTKHCCNIPRDIIEEAKGGYDTKFKRLLRSQPIGCMAKSESHECLLIYECSMAIKSVCTLHNCLPTKTPLPICWEFSPLEKINDVKIKSVVIEIGTIIGQAWRNNSYLILVNY